MYVMKKKPTALTINVGKSITIEPNRRGSQSIFLLLFFFSLIFVLKKKKLLIGPIAGRHVSWGPRYSDDPGSVQ